MSKPAEQLGLALNLESLIQIQSQLATEISRDIESPNDSKFHYAIPRMKNTLLSMEQVRTCERREAFCACWTRRKLWSADGWSYWAASSAVDRGGRFFP